MILSALPDQRLSNEVTAMLGMPCLLVVLLWFRAWTRSLAKDVKFRQGAVQGGITWRIFRAMAWRGMIALPVAATCFMAFAGTNPDAVRNAATGFVFGLAFYPIAMLSVWQLARRMAFGALKAVEPTLPPDPRRDEPHLTESATFHSGRLQPEFLAAGRAWRRFLPTVVEGAVLGWIVLVYGSMVFTLGFGAIAQRSKLPKPAMPANDAAASRTPAAATNPPPPNRGPQDSPELDELLALLAKEDPTYPLRMEAGLMADALQSSGLSEEEAKHIALRKMPGSTTVDWWRSEFLPRFQPDARVALTRQLERYLEVSRKASEEASNIDFAEQVAITLLQQELKFSDVQCFDLWQAGLSKQNDDWWTAQLARLSPAKRSQLSKLRATIKPPGGTVSANAPTLRRNEDEIFTLLRSWGLKSETEREMRAHRLENYSREWWESGILARLDAQSKTMLREKLAEREKLRGVVQQ